MKKFIIILLSVLTLSVAASAQPKAIGLRLANGAEITYQNYLGARNFLEVDLGWMGSSGFHLSGIYDFHLGSAGNFNFYVGPGVSLGFYNNDSSTDFSAAIVGQLGAEFVIPGFPMNISLDWRPAIYLTGQHFGWQGFGLGLKYRF